MKSNPPMFDPGDWPIAWMARAERQHARNATALLVPLGLHHREFRLLAFLAQVDGLSIGELAERAVLERPTVSKMVDRLVIEGWVTRGEHAQDRRRSPLALTAAGHAKFAAAVPVVEGLLRRYQQDMAPDAHGHFLHELKDFCQRVHEARTTGSDGADSSDLTDPHDLPGRRYP